MTERPLLQVRDLAKTFDVSPPLLNRLLQGQPQAFVQAIDDVGFDIPRGTTFSLVGESGSGKSTVARVVVGLYRPTRGSVTFDGTDLASIKSRRQMAPLRRRWAMIFQDPYASLNPRWRVRTIIAEPIRTHGLARDEAASRRRVGELLELVGLSGPGRREVRARILRRAAPAHLDRPGAGERAGLPGLRRADQRARRLGAGADPQPDEAPAARTRSHLPVHQPRPRGGLPHLRPRRGNVPGPAGRVGAGARAVRPPADTPIPGCCWRRSRTWR